MSLKFRLISENQIFATNVNSADYMKGGGVLYRIIKDHLGSPRLVVNASTGQVLQKMDYNEWGHVTLDTNPGFQAFGYAGGLYDPDTKLVKFGARDYDGRVGRWLSKDPIGFDGGDTNLYGYVLGDPVNYHDPKGEQRSLPVAYPESTFSTKPNSMGRLGAAAIGVCLKDAFSQRKGERNKTSKNSGTPKPFKHMKPDPKNEKKILEKDTHDGNWKSKPKPPGFDEYWENRK